MHYIRDTINSWQYWRVDYTSRRTKVGKLFFSLRRTSRHEDNASPLILALKPMRSNVLLLINSQHCMSLRTISIRSFFGPLRPFSFTFPSGHSRVLDCPNQQKLLQPNIAQIIQYSPAVFRLLIWTFYVLVGWQKHEIAKNACIWTGWFRLILFAIWQLPMLPPFLQTTWG